jgi:hypothetical protein
MAVSDWPWHRHPAWWSCGVRPSSACKSAHEMRNKSPPIKEFYSIKNYKEEEYR